MKLDRECVKLWQEKDRSYLRNFRASNVKIKAKNLFLTMELTMVNRKANGITPRQLRRLNRCSCLEHVVKELYTL